MKQIGYGVLMVLCLTTANFSHSQKPLNHEKQIYVSPEEKVYIQKEMPVYLRISTSPDKEAKSYLLKSEDSKEYTNPMFFDTEGWNTLRSPSAVDTSTKNPVYPQQDVIFEVYADSKPPTTSLKIPDEQPYKQDGKRYYGKEIQIELSARDGLSGTEDIYYSLNGEPYHRYEDPIQCKEEKHYVLKYYAIDHVRNVESPDSLDFYLDVSAPQTQYSIEGKSKKNILGQDAVIKLTSKDSLSGVKEIRYSINEGTEKTYRDPLPVSLFDKDENKLAFYAIDHVNNKEELQSLTSSVEQSSTGSDNEGEAFSYYIDKDPPKVDLQVAGDNYEGEQLFVSGRSKLELKAEDDKSGVKKISYSINNSSLSNAYDEPFKLDQDGLVYLNFAATDQVGNQSKRETRAIYKDTVLPESTIHYEGTHYLNRDTLFVRADTKFSMTGSDEESGLQHILYSIDDDHAEKYGSPIRFTEPGLHNLSYFAVDRVDNREENHSIKIYVDETAPEIYPHFSVDKIGSKDVRGEKYVIYPSNSKLYIGATDQACGTADIQYTINGGDTKREIPIKQFEPGNYVIEITAYDQLDNKTKETIKFAIEH